MPLRLNPVTGELDLVLGPGSGTATVQVDTDSGSANPTAAGILNVLGGTGVTVTGASNTVTITALNNGDVVGPASSTDNAIARYDGTTGKLLQNSNVTIGDSDTVDGITQLNVDNLRLDGNTISSVNTNGDINLSPDGTGLVLSPNTMVLNSTTGESTITIGGVTLDTALIVHSVGATDLAEITFERHSDTAGFGAHTIFARSRGDESSETIVSSGDVLSQLVSVGHDGTDFEQAANIRVEVDGTPGAGDMPGRILMLTSADGAASPIEGFRLDNTQTVTLANALPVASGGSGRATHTAYAVICGGTTTTAAQQSIASVGTSGQVLTSNGAAALPTFQAAAGGGGITWNEVTGTSQAMAVDNGYMANNAGLVTLTLPDTAALGSILRVAGSGAGGWLIAQNAGETIHFISSDTTAGAGGSLASTVRYDSVELICIIADTNWAVISSMGNITVV